MKFKDCLLQTTYRLALIVLAGIAGNRIAYFLGGNPMPFPGFTFVLVFCVTYLVVGSFVLYRQK